MHVAVDQAGQHRAAAAVDLVVAVETRSDADDPTVLDHHVAGGGRRPAAVEHLTTAQHSPHGFDRTACMRAPPRLRDSPMRLNLTADEVLTTTRSVRKRLDFDRPVEREIVMECLDIALQAPTGSNSQGGSGSSSRTPTRSCNCRDIYRENFRMYRDMPRPKYDEDDPRAGRQDAVIDSADYLSENFHRAPMLLIPCLKGKPDVLAGSAGFWGSLLPAVWSFMLAAPRARHRLGVDTLHLINGGEQRAAELLGIPFERYSQAGLFPIAYTQGTDFKLGQPASGVTARPLGRMVTDDDERDRLDIRP